MYNQPKISVAIPAYNEQENIALLLMQVINQKGNFNLEQIVVLTDGCTDKTANIVREISLKYKKIKLLEFKNRKGKVYRLNQIYKFNKSDILITFDADIKLKDNFTILNIIKEFNNNTLIDVIAIHQIPIRPSTFIGKCIYGGYSFWDEARLSVRNFDNIQNLYGAATAYRYRFTSKFRFPKDITDDRGYLYIKAKEAGGFVYTKLTNIFYLPVSTFHDFRKLSDRSFDKNRDQLKKYFDGDVDTLYKIPTSNKIKAIVKVFFNNPFYCLMGLVLNIYTRLFPLHDSLYNSKMWEISESTKKLI